MTPIYPMFAMVLLTMIVGFLTAYKRMKSAYAGEVDHRYFRVMSGYEINENLAKYGRNFNNLFEVPTLFYVAGVSALTLNIMTQTFLIFMWIFVILRVIHSIIHLTYNNPLHRFIPFVLSFTCVVAMWFYIVLTLN